MSDTLLDVIENALIYRAMQRAEVKLPMAHPDARVRHSDAGKCSRAIAYRAAGVESEPMDEAGAWVTYLGSLVHEQWQAAILDDTLYHEDDNITAEEKVFIAEIPSAGHADLIHRHDDIVDVYELKTINGTGFRKLDGPRDGHLLQVGLNAYGAGTHDRPVGQITLVYLAMEAVSGYNATKLGLDSTQRYLKTYRYDWADVLPLVEIEIARLRSVIRRLDMDDNGPMPQRIERRVPGAGLVIDPSNGKLEGGGRTWHCDYCPFQQECVVSARFGDV